MAKRILSILIALLVIAGMFPLTAVQANAKSVTITKRSKVDGSDYTVSPALAAKLDEVFAGNANIYTNSACTRPADVSLGTSRVKNNGVYLYVGSAQDRIHEIGTSCFIYANGIYYTLFGETTGAGTAGENSEKLKLSNTSTRKMTYKNFKAWGVRKGVGALIRASGHSMILLGYNSKTITYLDGNGDGNGLVAIRKKSWDKLSSSVEYIIQPTDSHYAALYGCGWCDSNLFWSVDDEGTLTISGSGTVSAPGWEHYYDSIQRVIVRNSNIAFGDDVFSGCRNLSSIQFKADAPSLSERTFSGVTATIRYPITGKGWEAVSEKQYGGSLIWEPYGMTQLEITSQPHVVYDDTGTTASVIIDANGDGVTYSWYCKDTESGEYTPIPGADSSCSVSLEKRSGQEILCVVADQYGDMIFSQSVLL